MVVGRIPQSLQPTLDPHKRRPQIVRDAGGDPGQRGEALRRDQPSLHLLHAPAQDADLVLSVGIREYRVARFAYLDGGLGQSSHRLRD